MASKSPASANMSVDAWSIMSGSGHVCTHLSSAESRCVEQPAPLSYNKIPRTLLGRLSAVVARLPNSGPQQQSPFRPCFLRWMYITWWHRYSAPLACSGKAYAYCGRGAAAPASPDTPAQKCMNGGWNPPKYTEHIFRRTGSSIPVGNSPHSPPAAAACVCCVADSVEPVIWINGHLWQPYAAYRAYGCLPPPARTLFTSYAEISRKHAENYVTAWTAHHGFCQQQPGGGLTCGAGCCISSSSRCLLW